MRSGLMWLDDDPKRSLEAKVRDAAARYRARLGHTPGLCLVHEPSGVAPDAMREITLDAGAASPSVLVVGSRRVPRHCLWLGMPEPVQN